MAKKTDIDKILNDLYTKAAEWTDKLSVAKQMVELEKARLKSSDESGDTIPEGLKD